MHNNVIYADNPLHIAYMFRQFTPPFSRSWHQYFFETHCNKTGHYRLTYVVVSIHTTQWRNPILNKDEQMFVQKV